MIEGHVDKDGNETRLEYVDAATFNQVAQLAHFAGGLAAVWGSIVLFGPSAMWIAVACVAGITALKEFWYDQHFETEVVRGSNLEDWAFYQLGSSVAGVSAVGIAWLHAHL